MSFENIKDLLYYRINQAKDTLIDAELLLNNNSLRSAINRAYYAMFYALLALLATKSLGTSKHSAAISLVGVEYIKTNIFPREMSKSLHKAFSYRQEGDYGELIEIDRLRVQEIIINAKKFINEIENYLFP